MQELRKSIREGQNRSNIIKGFERACNWIEFASGHRFEVYPIAPVKKSDEFPSNLIGGGKLAGILDELGLLEGQTMMDPIN